MSSEEEDKQSPGDVGSSSPKTDVHLVLLLHGLYGSPTNLWCLEEEIRTAHEECNCDLDLSVVVVGGYAGAQTWDGIDVNAHTAAEEVRSLPDRANVSWTLRLDDLQTSGNE